MIRKFAYNKIFRTTGMLILLLLLLLFPASKEYTLDDTKTIKTSASEKKHEAFLLDKDGFIARCKVAIKSSNKEEYAKNLIELMIIDGKYESKVPNGFKAILPSDLKINSVMIDNDNITVDLSSAFNEIKESDEIKAIEMLTFNLTTINGIKNVYINIDGKSLTNLPNSKEILKQPLKRSDGINKTYDVTDIKNVSTTTVYYVNKNNSGYYYVPVTKINNDKRDKIKIIIDELTSSPIYETNLMSFLNYNTKLLNYEINNDALTLNFNKYLFDDINTSSILEEVIYTIALSVRENYDINEIVFNVDGEEITKSVIKNLE